MTLVDEPRAPARPAAGAPEPGASTRTSMPKGLRERAKDKVLGPALPNEALAHERLGRPTALAVFSSDALSSTAYATEEILKTLLAAGIGVAAFTKVLPITVAMVAVLAILMFSYRQTIKAYPSAGGAYIVTKDNLGLLPAQVAGVALLDRLRADGGRLGERRHRRALLGDPEHPRLPGADRARLHRPHRPRQPAGREGVGQALRRPDLRVRDRRDADHPRRHREGGDRAPPPGATGRSRPAPRHEVDQRCSSCCTPSPPAGRR